MKRLFSSADNARLALARSVLEAAGIRYELRNQALSQVIPTAAFGEELWVRDEDYNEASRLLASNEPNDSASGAENQ